MFVLSAHNNFYIILGSYVEEHVIKNPSLNFMSLGGFQAFKIWIFWKIYCGASFEIIFRQKSFPKDFLFLDFVIVFYMIWKNQ